ncbi:MAG: YceI family protein [Terracidiphilus sp.]|jgi:polyisoprenoid-binding protein YceI
MKRLAILAGILALAAPLALAQTSTWVSDPNHSEIDFSIIHMSVSKIHGSFGNVKATIVYNEADVTKSTVTATIGVDTVNTGVDARNTHLKSPDFFDVANLPTATFTSTSVVKNGSHLSVTGNLTLHGVTKPVVLDVVGPNGSMTDPKGKVHTGFSATTTIDRTAFGIGPKFPAAAIGDDVTLAIELEVVKQ